MISKQHCKIRYEPKVDLEDFAVFYDFLKRMRPLWSRKQARAATRSEGDSMVIVDTPRGEEAEGEHSGKMSRMMKWKWKSRLMR
jgi:hypothetical protein